MSPYDDMVTELPSGQLVCSQHHLIICGICTLDFSFMVDDDDNNDDDNDDDDDDDDEEDLSLELEDDDDGQMDLDIDAMPPGVSLTDEQVERMMGLPKRKRGTGRILPTKFIPPLPDTKPFDLFHGAKTYYHFARYIHRQDPSKGLIFTDGACLNNGQANPRAGWGFVAGPPELAGTYSCGNCSGRLEKKGPFGDDGAQTSNRAELRAVLAALGLRHWPGEGFKTLVFATDSEYVVEGATKWVQGWIKNGWKTANKKPVKNQDLWEMLLGEVEKFGDNGMEIQFWRIGRGLNIEADKLAKKGAAIEEVPDMYIKIFGI